MPTLLRNILIFLLGLIIGGTINYLLIMVSSMIITPPEGMGPTDINSIKEHLDQLQPLHYLMPFLAHALGTFVGAWIVASFVNTNKVNWAIAVGVFFMIGGVTNLVNMSSPIWFTILDLSIAYLPMAYLGYLWRRK